MPTRNESEEFERWRIRHRPDKIPRQKKDSMSSYELRSADEVAMILGITRQRVSQIEREALAKLRRGLLAHYKEL